MIEGGYFSLYILIVFLLCAFCVIWNRSPDVVESPRFQTVTSTRLGNNDEPVMANLTPAGVTSPGAGFSASIELPRYNAYTNATAPSTGIDPYVMAHLTPSNVVDPNTPEGRKEMIRNRLVFQQVLSLPERKKKTRKKKKSKSSKTKKSKAQDGSEARRTRKKKKIVRDIETGQNANEKNENDKQDDENDEDSQIHRGTNNTPRSILESIQLFVFFNHDFTDVDDEDILDSKKAMKDQLACSICLEEYVVGDVVVRLKGGNNTSDDSGADSCKHCFHEDCILEWLETHDECPLCRVNMLTDTP
jgi:hypothetical protein